MLNQVKGTDQRGEWTLFFADVSGGGVTELTSWSIQFINVPETSGGTVIAASLLGIWAIGRVFYRSVGLAKRGSQDGLDSILEKTSDRESFFGNCA